MGRCVEYQNVQTNDAGVECTGLMNLDGLQNLRVRGLTQPPIDIQSSYVRPKGLQNLGWLDLLDNIDTSAPTNNVSQVNTQSTTFGNNGGVNMST